LWRYVVYDGYTCVYPDDEYYKHDFKVYEIGDENKSECPCCPSLKYEGDILIVTHNSFDGREGVELVNEILKNK
jgi:hypothetical protein